MPGGVTLLQADLEGAVPRVSFRFTHLDALERLGRDADGSGRRDPDSSNRTSESGDVRAPTRVGGNRQSRPASAESHSGLFGDRRLHVGGQPRRAWNRNVDRARPARVDAKRIGITGIGEQCLCDAVGAQRIARDNEEHLVVETAVAPTYGHGAIVPGSECQAKTRGHVVAVVRDAGRIRIVPAEPGVHGDA